MNATVAIADVDQMNLQLESEPRGTTLYDQFSLIIRLDDYPSSTPAIF